MADARLREVGLPQQVGVAEHKLDRVADVAPGGSSRAYVVRIDVGAADDAARTDDVEHNLDVERPVARVVEDEDRGNRDA